MNHFPLFFNIIRLHLPHIKHASLHHFIPTLRLVVEHGTTLNRVCSQIRPRLLPDAVVPAPRGDMKS